MVLGSERVLRRICVSGCLKALENGLVKVSMTQKRDVVELKATFNGKARCVVIPERRKKATFNGKARCVVIPERRNFQEGVSVIYKARTCHS